MGVSADDRGYPNGWTLKRVGDLGEVIAGKALAVAAAGRPRPYLRTKNVFDGQIVVADVLEMPMTDEQFEIFRLLRGDVLLNEGQSLDLVGRCAIYSDEYPEPCAIQNALLRFRARQGVSPLFASYVFRHCQQTGVFGKVALQTTSIAHLGVSRFANLQLPWPDDEREQVAIAAALSDIDALLSGLDRLIAKKRYLKQAAMQQLLTGKTRLPGFEGEWDRARFDDVVQLVRERVDPRVAGIQDFCIELEHIDSGNGTLLGSTSCGVNASHRAVFVAGDVLFGKLRAYLRKYWLATRSGVCSTEIWVLRPRGHRLSSDFLYQLVKTTHFIEAASNAYGTHMPRSDWNIVGNLEIELPGMPEQKAIGSVLSDMDAELEALEARREKTRVLKQGMMQELLTGRTRLV